MGRLFDTVAALLGFTRGVTFEGQAAIWVEQIARAAPPVAPLPMPFDVDSKELDPRPLLRAVIEARLQGRDVPEIARAVHAGLAAGTHQGIAALCEEHGARTVVLSGGVFQNELLLEDLGALLGPFKVWVNREVPANDGGISLGQAALALQGE